MAAATGNTRTISRNSFWYGLEMALGTIAVFGISIPMARVLGPQRIGYFNYIGWLVNMTGLVGSAGIPIMTRKYIAEYLGKDEPGIVRAIYTSTLRLQVMIAVTITGAATLALLLLGDPAYHTVSLLQILAVFPAMVGFIPAQTNVAREDMRANVISSLTGTMIHLAAVAASLWLGWDLVGIACGILAARTTEALMRFVPIQRWIGSLPLAAIPTELKRKMVAFSGQSMAMLLLQAVVWDRSDIVLLKLRGADLAQITFFSIGFNLTEKMLMAPQVFGSALGTTMMAQYGRAKSGLMTLISESLKYVFLLSMPLLLGLAALSSPIIRVLYGRQYEPAIGVLALSAVFAIPKAVLLPAQTFLQANERQGFLLTWSTLSGIVNIVLDLLLIPKLGAMGAAIGNGTGQTMAVLGIWVVVIRWYGLRLDRPALFKIGGAGVGMFAVVVAATRFAPPWAALVWGVPLGAAVFLSLLRVLRLFGAHDRGRMTAIQQDIPQVARPFFQRVLNFVMEGAD
jgi:O-antigen/teichoic acid export membrane protein